MTVLPPRSSAPAGRSNSADGSAPLYDELLRAIDAAIAETGVGADQAPAVPGLWADVTTVPRRITAQTRAFTRTEKRMALAPRTPVFSQRLTFLYREVSSDALQIPPLGVEIAS